MDQYQTQKRFSDLLKEKDAKLYDCLDAIRHKGLEEWVPLLSFDRGSHAGYPHLLNVEQNANKMVPDYIKDGFSSGELFLLLAAIFLHDIGRIGAKDKNQIEAGKIEPEHNERSFDLINEYWAELGLPDERIARYCAYVCYYHGVADPIDSAFNIGYFQNTSLEPHGFLRIPFLSAVLRYADEAENCWKRTLQKYLFEQIKRSNISLFKGVRRFIEDVEFCHRGQCIIFHVPADFYFEDKQAESAPGIIKIDGKKVDSDVLDTLNNFARGMRNVLHSSWSGILSRECIPFRDVYFEYRNQLLSQLQPEGGKIKPEKLGEIIKPKESKSGKAIKEQEKGGKEKQNPIKRKKETELEEILDGILRLYMGSLQHATFTWHVLEAEIGKPVGDREKWLISRMNTVDQDLFFVSVSTDGYQIIHFDVEKMNEMREKLGYQQEESSNE